MIAARLLQRIEANADSIAQSVIDGRRRNPDMPNYRNLSDDEIRTRVRDLISSFSFWLASRDESRLAGHFADLGLRRRAEGMPLHEVLQKITLLKGAIRAWVSDQNYNLTPIEIYDELELLRSMSNYFDFITIHIARGYEMAAVKPPKAQATARADFMRA
jgi:hypothetical protein